MGNEPSPVPKEGEIGYVTGDHLNPTPTPGVGMFIVGTGTYDVDEREIVPALKWPESINTYDRMRNDPQVDALLRGMFQPIRRFRWAIDPDGASKQVVNDLAEDIGLPVIGQTRNARHYRRNRFNHGEHLRLALLAHTYGHMMFEQVGRIETGKRGRKMWRLHKLAPRLPHTIEEIKVARDGGLEWIRQKGGINQEKPIPITRLVVYTHEKEGANWFGRPLIRAAYQPWIIKDRLLRVDAIRHERNGMGVPIITLPERATEAQKKEAAKLVYQYKAGHASGGVLPFGMSLDLKGVEGDTSDVLASIRYHDAAMARLMLQLFTELAGNTDTGSRALGDSFIKFFANAQDASASEYAETFNDYVIADWVDWNYGPDEKPPTLVYVRDENPDLSAQEFAQLVAQGVLSVDDELENFLRDRYNLPSLKPGVRINVTQNIAPGVKDDDADPAFPTAPGNEGLNYPR